MGIENCTEIIDEQSQCPLGMQGVIYDGWSSFRDRDKPAEQTPQTPADALSRQMIEDRYRPENFRRPFPFGPN